MLRLCLHCCTYLVAIRHLLIHLPHNMPFTLEPNPSLYKKLFAQWEQEEQQRHQQEAASQSFLSSPRDQFFLLLFILIAIMQITLLLLQRRLSSKRAARRQLYRLSGLDAESGTITPSGRWEVDVKAPLSTDDE